MEARALRFIAVACAGELSPLAFYLDQVIKDTDTDDAKQLRGALHDAELKWLQRARDLGPSMGLTADQVYQKFLDYIAATTPPRLEGQTDQAHDKANLDSRVENINPCLAALRAVP